MRQRTKILGTALLTLLPAVPLAAQSFSEYCLDPDLSAAQANTVEVMMYKVGAAGHRDAETCAAAEAALLNREYLNLYPYPFEPARPAITDLEPLASLTHLRYLVLSGNAVSNLRPLSKLKRLELLNLFNNRISDVAPLAVMKNLKSLALSVNQISDITPLAGLRLLQDLSLADNQLGDISVVSNFTSLEIISAATAFARWRRLPVWRA